MKKLNIFRSRLGRRIMILMVLVGLLPLVIFTIPLYLQTRQTLLRESRSTLSDYGNLAGEYIIQILSTARFRMFRLTAPTATAQDLEYFNQHFFLGKNFNHRPNSLPWPLLRPRDMDVLKKNRVIITSPYRIGDQVTVALIVSDPQGGYLAAEMDPAKLWEVIRKGNYGPHDILMVIDDKGKILSSSSSFVPMKVLELFPSKIPFVGSKVISGQGKLFGKEKVYWNFKPLRMKEQFGSENWAIVSTRSLKAIQLFPERLFKIFIILLCLSLIVLLLLAISLGRRIVAPVMSLARSTRLLSSGNWDTQIFTKNDDELGDLAHDFNKMAEQLFRANEEKKRHIEELERQERFVSNILSSILNILIVVSPEDRIESLNPAACRLLGYEEDELKGKGIPVILSSKSPEDKTFAEKFILDGLIQNEETSLIHKDGRKIPVMFSATPLRSFSNEIQGFVLVAEDITKKRGLERQLRHSQKMEAIGQLAGGISHDFNNILTVILTNAQYILRGLKEDDPLREDIHELQASAKRASQLTHQLLAFSRKQIMSLEVIDLNVVADETTHLARRVLEEKIRVDFHPCKTPLMIQGDSLQLQQVILNFSLNARDAMAEGGILTIRLSEESFPKEKNLRTGMLRAGDYASFSISDTGTGMTEETLCHLFEPFFTTKEVGKGTGLGLSTAYGIIEQHQGKIDVKSEKGKGTIFSVFLPKTKEKKKISSEKKQGVFPKEKMPSDSIFILLVEDEEAVRKVAKKILVDAGYHILEASNGQEGLRQSELHQGKLHLLFTDVVMPEMSGTEMSQEIRKKRKDIRILYSSGYTDDAIIRYGVQSKNMDFIAKPYLDVELIKKIKEMLS